MATDRLLTVLLRGDQLYLISRPIVARMTDVEIALGPFRTRPEVLAGIQLALRKGTLAPRFSQLIQVEVANLDLPWTVELNPELNGRRQHRPAEREAVGNVW